MLYMNSHARNHTVDEMDSVQDRSFAGVLLGRVGMIVTVISQSEVSIDRYAIGMRTSMCWRYDSVC